MRLLQVLCFILCVHSGRAGYWCGQSAAIPAVSCLGAYQDCSVQNRAIYIQPSIGVAPYMVYCGDSGLVLAMLINGGSGTFLYDSPYWTSGWSSGDPLAGDPTQYSVYTSGLANRIFRPFNENGASSFRFCMSGAPVACLNVPVSFSSLRSLFSSGFTSTSLPDSQWVSAAPSGYTMPGCTQGQGININVLTSDSACRWRVGFIWDEVSSCPHPDGGIGIAGSCVYGGNSFYGSGISSTEQNTATATYVKLWVPMTTTTPCCQPGYYCPTLWGDGISAPTMQVQCPAGYYCPACTMVPLPCDAGYWGTPGQTTSSCAGLCANVPGCPTAPPSASSTRPPSATRTPTRSETPSQSVSASVSLSSTPSQSVSRTQLNSGTHSMTPSATLTRTPSGTSTPSVSASASQSGTESSSASLSGSPSTSASPSQSISASQSQTLSPSQSQTQTPSQSLSLTASQSQTHSPSVTQTLSRTQSQSPSATSTASSSASPSQSQSASLTMTTSRSPSQTPTYAPVAIVAAIQGAQAASLHAAGIAGIAAGAALLALLVCCLLCFTAFTYRRRRLRKLADIALARADVTISLSHSDGGTGGDSFAHNNPLAKPRVPAPRPVIPPKPQPMALAIPQPATYIPPKAQPQALAISQPATFMPPKAQPLASALPTAAAETAPVVALQSNPMQRRSRVMHRASIVAPANANAPAIASPTAEVPVPTPEERVQRQVRKSVLELAAPAIMIRRAPSSRPQRPMRPPVDDPAAAADGKGIVDAAPAEPEPVALAAVGPPPPPPPPAPPAEEAEAPPPPPPPPSVQPRSKMQQAAKRAVLLRGLMPSERVVTETVTLRPVHRKSIVLQGHAREKATFTAVTHRIIEMQDSAGGQGILWENPPG